MSLIDNMYKVDMTYNGFKPNRAYPYFRNVANPMKKNNIIKDKIFLLVIVLLSVFISLSVVSCTVEPKKYVIAIINPNPGLNEVVEKFKSGLNGYGYVEGKNTTYIYVNNAREIDPALQEFKKNKVDLIFTLTTPATIKAKIAMEGTGIPVVFGTSYDPVKGGIVKSLLHQEENITGIKVGGGTQKALEWLLRIAPEVKRIFVPVKFDTEATSLSLEELKKIATKLKIELIISNIETLQDLKAALSSIPENVGAIFIVNSIFIVSNIDIIVETAIQRKLPTGAGMGQYKNGVTITYGQDYKHSGEQASRLADKILQGIPASSLPVETADYFLGINLKTAKAIDLEIPDDILIQADFVVR